MPTAITTAGATPIKVAEYRRLYDALSQAFASLRGVANETERKREAEWVRATARDLMAAHRPLPAGDGRRPDPGGTTDRPDGDIPDRVRAGRPHAGRLTGRRAAGRKKTSGRRNFRLTPGECGCIFSIHR